jgi:hypothetical protein
MRYIAELQRFDSAHVTVAEGPHLAMVQEAAIAIYTALIPEILNQSKDYVRDRVNPTLQGKERLRVDDDEIETCRQLQRDGVSGYLRAKEWGIGVYDTQPENLNANYSELVFWVGATREDPRSERKVVRQ